MHIGQTLKKKRGKMSTEKLAALAGVSRQTIENVENGGKPTFATIEKIARALKCQVLEFVK
jgi:transcriptional regulator with XRE-family HTH domain